MKKNLAIVALFLTATACVPAQDGGKLAWLAKGSNDARPAMAEAGRQGLPMMLFFTSDG